MNIPTLKALNKVVKYLPKIFGIVAATFISCRSSHGNSPAQVEFLGADSVTIEGVLLVDSSKLVLPLEYSYLDKDTTLYNTMGNSLDDLHLNKTGHLVVANPLCGYNVTANIYDSEDEIYLSIIEYHLKKSGQEFVIKTTYDPRYFPIPDESSAAPGSLPVYTIHDNPLLVQDDNPDFKSVLFCFKDVDFDGEKEFCCIQPGYNRHYFCAYKLQLGTARLMEGAPYGNLVIGDYDVAASTVFDYTNQTITVSEQFGASGYNEDIYVLNHGHLDVLNPMRRKYGRHVESTMWSRQESIFQDDQLAEETMEFYLLDGHQSITAKYVHANNNTLHLRSITYACRDGEESYVMWENKN